MPPRYAWLHECLLNDITSGKYPLGTLLPTEAQLSKTYGVSRHTVREATRRLVDSGMIVRKPAVGTVVSATSPTAKSSTYAAGLGSMKELMAYTDRTRLEMFDESILIVDKAMAEALKCEAGSKWIVLHTNRYLIEEDRVISYTRVHLRPEFAGIKATLQGRHPSIYTQLQEQYGQEIHTVRQEIEATLMPDNALAQLDYKAGSPALRIVRSYCDRHDRLLAVSDNFYIADRFKLLTAWHKEE